MSAIKVAVFVYVGAREVVEGSLLPHRWRNARTSHAGGTTAATCDFCHLVMTW